MATTVMAGAVEGVDGVEVQVEVDLVRRLPRVTVVGLPASAVKESTERVRSAILASGLDFPKQRVTINLAPADVRKDGTAFDLPIALGVLAAAGVVPEDSLAGVMAVGELSLTGALRDVPGALPLALLARQRGVRALILPETCAGQGAVVPGLNVLSATNLSEVVDWLNGKDTLKKASFVAAPLPAHSGDLADVRGQALARRALEIAAAGGHNLLLIGAPGSGKTMLASRLPGLLPPMTFEEAIETTRVHSVAGLLPEKVGILEQRPFRSPHHSISPAGLLGGASLRPGELSLAHHGVLFLDELPEFSRGTLEQLRSPLERREVVIARSAGAVTLPASCMLVAAANPCECGFWGHPNKPCRCGDSALKRYRQRLSGPLLDRIDLCVRVDPVESEELFSDRRRESSAQVRIRVISARRAQTERYKALPIFNNAMLDGPACREAAQATPAGLRLLRDSMERLSLSARACDRVLKVARTIADLDGVARVDVEHVAEAAAFRAQDSVDAQAGL
ncbi:MAG: YifB family Mg chelatase-like AAA ATPase [Deltaproteobacteria bacterium]|nr:YifB family Mg chelatase-like AAA ATPase [Deltaproteobacteria bacterium]